MSSGKWRPSCLGLNVLTSRIVWVDTWWRDDMSALRTTGPLWRESIGKRWIHFTNGRVMRNSDVFFGACLSHNFPRRKDICNFTVRVALWRPNRITHRLQDSSVGNHAVKSYTIDTDRAHVMVAWKNKSYWSEWRVKNVTMACTCTSVLTHLPLDKMAAISQTIVSDAFSWMKILCFD